VIKRDNSSRVGVLRVGGGDESMRRTSKHIGRTVGGKSMKKSQSRNEEKEY
jgi:hypothetical protein